MKPQRFRHRFTGIEVEAMQMTGEEATTFAILDWVPADRRYLTDEAGTPKFYVRIPGGGREAVRWNSWVVHGEDGWRPMGPLAFAELYEPITEPVGASVVSADTSDGYHTFAELYHYRMLYNALAFNEWASSGKYGVHKSIRHSDGEPCFGGGWFVVVAQLPTGQISNHYELGDWHLFKVPTRGRAAQWDGHTPQIAAERMAEFLEEGL